MTVWRSRGRRGGRTAFDHGPLYTVVQVTPGAGGDVIQLDRAVTAPATATGRVVRRWDGQATGATTPRNATFRGADLGVTFSAATGTYLAGDWWGSRLRAAEGDGIEHRVGAAPDGTLHASVPLALVDVTSRTVLHDCRPTFTPLVDIDPDRGACTVSVKPGDDLQEAVDSLPAGGGELCLAAGLYTVATPVVVSGRARIVMAGAGPASIVRAQGHEAAIVFERCNEIEVRHLRIEGGSPGAPPGDAHRDGALTFASCRDVTVADCVLACPDATGEAQTCLTVRQIAGGVQPDRVRVEGNRVEIGAWQTGVLVLDALHARVERNHLLLRRAPAIPPLVVTPVVAEELRRRLRLSLRSGRGAGTRTFTLGGADARLHVSRTSDLLPIVEDFARTATRATIRRARDPGSALLAFARAIGAGRGLEGLSQESRDLIQALGETLRAALQGIVVGGTSVGAIQVCDNVVEGAVQGIHVGVSHARVAGTESADSVMVARNVVDAMVPVNYARDRHAVFVGNARTIHVLDTVASLRRIGRLTEGTRPTPVEGVRIHGHLGPFMVVRQASLDAFTVGVRVVPLNPAPNTRVWLVAETAAQGAATALAAPASVDRVRVS